MRPLEVPELANLIEERRLRCLGLSGPPGSGKTTLARELIQAVKGTSLSISLDDYYLSTADRAARGLTWRGPPGSHDLAALIETLTALRDGVTPVVIRRFSPERDEPAEPEIVEEIPDLVIIEGFYLGYEGDGYGALLDFVDLLIYLDVPTELAKQRRFEREAELRRRGGGFSEDEMQRFWDEVLEPGIETWTADAKKNADRTINAS